MTSRLGGAGPQQYLFPAGMTVWHLTHSPTRPTIDEWWPLTHFGTKKAAEGVHLNYLETHASGSSWKGDPPRAWLTQVSFADSGTAVLLPDGWSPDAAAWVLSLREATQPMSADYDRLTDLKASAIQINLEARSSRVFFDKGRLNPDYLHAKGLAFKEQFAATVREAFAVLGTDPPDLIAYPNDVEDQSISYMTLKAGIVTPPTDWQEYNPRIDPRH